MHTVTGLLFISAILTAYNVMRLDRIKCANDLQLFVANSIGIKFGGRFHRDQAQQLHQVVLHHVPHRPGLIVIAAPPFYADGLCHCDLDVIDVLRVPQRFEQHIAKAYGHQVLDRFFAQIMVDAVNLRFVEMLRQRRVQRPRGFQIVTERLFHNDAAVFVRQTERPQAFGDIPEQRRTDREIESADDFVAQTPLKGLPSAFAFGVDRFIAQALQELVQLILIVMRSAKFLNGFANELTIAVVIQFTTGRTNDLRFGRHLP